MGKKHPKRIHPYKHTAIRHHEMKGGHEGGDVTFGEKRRFGGLERHDRKSVVCKETVAAGYGRGAYRTSAIVDEGAKRRGGFVLRHGGAPPVEAPPPTPPRGGERDF